MSDLDLLMQNASFSQMIYNDSARRFIQLSWNDKLLTVGVWGLPGGWPLFCLFYGVLFVVAWIVIYFILKKGNYK